MRRVINDPSAYGETGVRDVDKEFDSKVPPSSLRVFVALHHIIPSIKLSLTGILLFLFIFLLVVD